MIIFDDAAVACIKRLRPLTPAEKFLDHVPGPNTNETRPKRFVWLTSDGGPRGLGVSTQRVRVNVFAEDPGKAIELAAQVDGLMCDQVADGKPIARIRRLSGPFEVADDSSAARRYLLFEVVLHGRDA